MSGDLCTRHRGDAVSRRHSIKKKKKIINHSVGNGMSVCQQFAFLFRVREEDQPTYSLESNMQKEKMSKREK